MIYPTISVLKDVNKTLLFIEALSNNSVFPQKSAVLRAISSISYGDKKGHEDTYIFLSQLGLIAINDDYCQITPLGKSFTKLNKEKFAEVNPKQKIFLLNILLRDHEFYYSLISLLKLYGFPKIRDVVIDLSLSNVPHDKLMMISMLRWLGFFNLSDEVLKVNTNYLHNLLQKKEHFLSAEQLKVILQEQLKYSKKAERLALEFEKRRLQKLGLEVQSKLVRLVADENVSLGYDLISFSQINSLNYDRFIEVKCSKGDKVKFYWTLNEYNVAKKLGNQYWIYFFPNISTHDTPLLFCNPLKIFKAPKYNVVSTEFVVEEN